MSRIPGYPLPRSAPSSLAQLLVRFRRRLGTFVIDGPLALLGRLLAQGAGHLADVRAFAAAAAADVIHSHIARAFGEVAQLVARYLIGVELVGETLLSG